MSVCEKERLSDVSVVSVSKIFFVLLILSVFAAPLFVSDALAADGEDAVASAIDRAEAAVASAYEAVLSAEQTGVDVSGLLVELNVAGEYLAEAHSWYRLGDFDNATRFADLCHGVGEEVRSEACELKNEAYGLWVMNLWLKLFGSIIGVVVVVLLSFVVWRVFRRRYRRRVLGLRPEVVSGES